MLTASIIATLVLAIALCVRYIVLHGLRADKIEDMEEKIEIAERFAREHWARGEEEAASAWEQFIRKESREIRRLESLSIWRNS